MKKSREFAHNYLDVAGAYVLMLFLFLAAFMACLPQEATAAWTRRVIDGGYVGRYIHTLSIQTDMSI